MTGPLLLVTGLAFPALVQAEKTDVVVLDNGDRLTGEVKRLRQGRLEFKTDSMGTVYVEWDYIASLSTVQYLEVETTERQTFYGSLVPAEEAGSLVLAMYVQGMAIETEIEMPEIVGITPIKRGFLQRLDGSFDLGLTATQSNSLRQYSIGFATSHRTRNYLTALEANSLFSSQKEAEDVNRHSAVLSTTRFLGKNFIVAFGQAQHNSQLGLDLRVMAALGGGRSLIHTNRSLLNVGGGLAYSEEEYIDGTGFDGNLEALLTLRYDYFLFDTPKTNISVNLLVFPSLTVSGRYRVELDTSVRRELVKDLFLALSLLDSFDSDPPTVGGEENDWSVVTSVGYSW